MNKRANNNSNHTWYYKNEVIIHGTSWMNLKKPYAERRKLGKRECTL